MKISEVLVRRRLALNATHRQIAFCVGVAEGTISHYEKGTYSPRFDVAQKLARVLGFSLDDLEVAEFKTLSQADPNIGQLAKIRKVRRLEKKLKELTADGDVLLEIRIND